MDKSIKKYLSLIGKNGGKKSRRILTKETAKQMVLIREMRRSFKKFHAMCFWSFDKNYKLVLSDFDWVVRKLKENGNFPVLVCVQKLIDFRGTIAIN